MLEVLGLMAALVSTDPPKHEVAVAGDSVIITVTYSDNVAAQPVAVDSVQFYISVDRGVIGGITDTQTVAVGKQVGATTGRFAYPLTMWSANQTLSGRVGARLGRINPENPGSALWSSFVYIGNPAGGLPAWKFTRDLRAPNAPEAGTIEVEGVELN